MKIFSLVIFFVTVGLLSSLSSQSLYSTYTLKNYESKSYVVKDIYGSSYKNTQNLYKDYDNDGVINCYDRHDTNPYSTFNNYNGSNFNTGKYYNYNSSNFDLNTNKTIYTGPKGGQYYINSNGNKSYIKNW